VFLTIVVGLLPLAVLALLVLLRQAQNQRDQVLDSTQGAMRAIVSAVDAELSAAASSLDALAASPRLAANDYKGLHAEAVQLLSRRPSWVNVVLSDVSAQQLMNAHISDEAPLPIRVYPEGIAETVRNGRTTIGNVIYSPILKTYAFPVQIPIRRNGRIVQVLSAVLRPDALKQLLTEQPVPKEGVVGIVDRNFNFVARSSNHDKTVGRPSSGGLREMLASGRTSGWARTSTLEGVPVYSVVYRSGISGWTAAIGVPRSLVDAPVERSYVLFGGLIAASVLMGVVAALLVSRAITRPMRELKAAADAVGSSHPPVMPKTELPEIREVAAALASAHAEREARLSIERKATQVEHEARLAAERENRLKDEFLAMLGHELRNPLAAITSASLVLEATAGKPNSERAIENAVRIIRRQGATLTRLTDDLLDAARVVLGRIQLEREPIDFSALVQNVLDILRNTGRLARHHVTASLQPAWIQGDVVRMEQVVSNLLTNAVKYTPAGGTIEVRTERSGSQVLLRVRDSGIGVEPDLLPRIFDLFVQGERALDRSQGGLGIGLTMVRRLTELHEGTIQVVSPGRHRGTEFTVSLPAIEPNAASVPGPLTQRGLTPRRVVIVEDNADVLASLRSLLELAGHTVFDSGDGRSGLQLIIAQKPDVALIDVGLPLMDGLELARTLRSRAEARSVLLVAMSGYGTPEDIRKGLEAGFDHYLVKPVDEMKLRDVIRRAKPEGNVVQFGRQQ